MQPETLAFVLSLVTAGCPTLVTAGIYSAATPFLVSALGTLAFSPRATTPLPDGKGYSARDGSEDPRQTTGRSWVGLCEVEL